MTKTEIMPQEDKRSYKIKVSPVGKPSFVIPVIDVRDGDFERVQAKLILNEAKVNKRSKYLHPSFGSGGGSYQTSRKPI